MKEKDLLKLKTKINDAKETSLKLEGEKEALMKQLKKEFGCDTVSEAEAKLKQLEKKNKKTQKDIDEGISKLKKELENEKT
jgi:hypothetical protein